MPPDHGPPSDRPTAHAAGVPAEDGAGRLVGGRYRLGRSLGRGGMGVVWAARDETLDRGVAIKEVTLPPGLDEHQRDQLRTRTLREARAAARIRSEAAVTVFDVVEEDGRPWIVMELLPARSLADVLREEGPLPADEAARTGLRVLEALTAAHAAGVLHRDVKPANVLFDAGGRAVLTDFGIASLEGDPSMTTTGTVVGSPGYVAPERGLGRAPTAASDLWSLGVTLAAAVHGRSPFERDTALATMVSAMQDPLPEEVRTGPLGPVIERLLRKEPTERPDVDETRRLLEAAAEGRLGADPSAAATGTTTVLAAPAPVEGPGAQRTQALPHVPAAAAPAALFPAAGSPGGARPRAAGARPAGPAPVGPRPSRPSSPRPVPAVAPGRRSRLLPVLLLVVGLVVAAMVVAVALDRRGDDPTTAVDPAAGVTPEGTTDPAATAAPPPADPAPEPDPVDDAEDGDGEDSEGEDGDGEEAAPPVVEPVAPPAAPAPDAAGQVPAGFQLYTDDAYTVAVPEGWTVDVDSGTRTYFRDPASRRYLLVEEGGAPAGDPLEDWERQERSVSQSGRLSGYELIGIERADYRDFDAADWQFTWEADGGPLRVLNRAVVTDDPPRAFALYWSVPVEEWEAGTATFEQIAASFQPTG